ncbi:MFS transporter [Neolewinella agarilytica]|uniref:Na+/melibiose symporter n=1 Tax=Neolewinella agarilytica TaxID=478744 RepID=A0A1H9MLX7_9BACT|nr:MFS transporter [Neolewinella agarilytica]SER24465.1 Na+/melibiose symporter [Neolewinella agarilytica]
MPSNNLSRSQYALLSLPATAMGFALCVQISALSWILNTQYGLNLEEIGLVWLAGPLAGILGQVIVGVVSDNVWFMGGRRRPFIVIGGTIAALMILALPFLDVISEGMGVAAIATVALTVALTLDLAINISFNPARSVIADVTPEGEARTKGFTIMQTISGAFGVGAYLVAVIFNNYALIYLGAIIVFLFSVIPPFFITEPRSLDAAAEQEAEGMSAAAMDSTIDDVAIPKNSMKLNRGTDWPEFLKICFAHAFTWVGVQTMFIYTFGYIKSNIMGFDVNAELDPETNDLIGKQIGIAFAVLNTVGFLLPALVLEPIARKIGRVKTHAIAIAISAVGYLLIVLFGYTSIYAFGALMAVVGIGWAAIVSLPFAIMTETVDQRKMGLMMGLFNLSVVLPQVVASLLGGYIEHAADKSLIYMISTGTLAVSAALWLLVREQHSGVVGAAAGAGGSH